MEMERAEGEPWTDADCLVAKYVLEHLDDHKASCSEARVRSFEAADGFIACDSGCEGYEIRAVVECPHEPPSTEEVGGYGELLNEIDGLREAS